MRQASRYRDVVEVGDILGAMADSLMERQPKKFQPKLKFQEDDSTSSSTAVVSSSIKRSLVKPGKRPPREIFYRQTSMFLTNLPTNMERHKCNVACLCDGDLATLICHSCSIYQPSQKAFYCNKCFGRMHPWHRIPHIYTSISTNEDIEHSLRISHHIAETKRYEHDSQDILKRVVANRDILVKMGENERKMEDKLWDYGRRMLSLEDHVHGLRQQLYEDMLEQSMKKSLVAEEDAMKLARIQEERQRLQARLSQVAAARAQTPKDDTSVRVASPQVYGYYVPGVKDSDDIEMPNGSNVDMLVPLPDVGVSVGVDEEKNTEPNVLAVALLDQGVEQDDVLANVARDLHDVNYGDGPINSSVDNSTIAPETADNIELTPAATILTRIGRGFLARKIVSKLLVQRVVRVFSPTYGRDYFYDRVTGGSSWVPTKLLRGDDLETLPYIQEAAQEVKWCCKMRAMRHLAFPFTAQTTVRVLQNFGRCILARKAVIAQANARYRRVYDKGGDHGDGTWYYSDLITGGSSWDKPKIYCSLEPPVWVDGEHDAVSVGGEKKFSPRINRL